MTVPTCQQPLSQAMIDTECLHLNQTTTSSTCHFAVSLCFQALNATLSVAAWQTCIWFTIASSEKGKNCYCLVANLGSMCIFRTQKRRLITPPANKTEKALNNNREVSAISAATELFHQINYFLIHLLPQPHTIAFINAWKSTSCKRKQPAESEATISWTRWTNLLLCNDVLRYLICKASECAPHSHTRRVVYVFQSCAGSCRTGIMSAPVTLGEGANRWQSRAETSGLPTSSWPPLSQPQSHKHLEEGGQTAQTDLVSRSRRLDTSTDSWPQQKGTRVDFTSLGRERLLRNLWQKLAVNKLWAETQT